MSKWAERFLANLDKKKVTADDYHSPQDQDGIQYDRLTQKPEMLRSGMECTACGYQMASNMEKNSADGVDAGGMSIIACPKCGGPMKKFGGDQYPKMSPNDGAPQTGTTDDNSLLKKYMSDGAQIQASRKEPEKFSFKWSKADQQ